jgi:hypothetical protein
MPVAASITLNTKVYTPRGTDQGVTTWGLTGDASFGGGLSFVNESVRGPSKDGVWRTRWTLSVPKLATVDSSCGCVGQQIGQGYADIQVRVPTIFTLAERQDLADRLQALVALAVFDQSISIPEGSWG